MMYISIITPLMIGGFIGIFFGRYFGLRGIICLILSNCFFSNISAITCIVESNILNQYSSILFSTWFEINNFIINYEFSSGVNNSIMGFTVSIVTSCVLLFTCIYMINDPHLVRFISYISLFAGFMTILLFSNNLCLLLIGWEGIGVCSFKLIGFWFARLNASKSALKAIIINRISDVVLMLSTSYLWYFLGSVNFNYVNLIKNNSLTTILSILIIIGCMAKSALFLLHTWLADAMEGPTPVSALIHAATLVTAGIFVLSKCNQLWHNSQIARSFLLLIGCVTALISAISGLAQLDIKKIIAFSTCSQLGYMTTSIGLLLPDIGLYHTVTHAFFKAGLFLIAGTIINYSNSQQDNRLSGSIHLVSWASVALSIVISSLCGSFFTAGYYSKDLIIETGLNLLSPIANLSILILINGILLTSWYSSDIQFMTGILIKQSNRANIYQTSTNILLALPILILGLMSLWVGYLLEDGFSVNTLFIYYCQSDFLPVSTIILIVYCLIVGSLICLVEYPIKISLFIWLNTRLGFDWIYNKTIGFLVLNYSMLFNLVFESAVFDKLGYLGVKNLLNKITIFVLNALKNPTKNILMLMTMLIWFLILI